MIEHAVQAHATMEQPFKFYYTKEESGRRILDKNNHMLTLSIVTTMQTKQEIIMTEKS